MSNPKRFRIFHVSPGLVQYSVDNKEHLVLVKKQCLDDMNQTFVGKPIFNETHKDIEASKAFDFSGGHSEELADGVVTAAGYDEEKGKHWIDAMIWTERALANIKNGYGVSNAYIVDKSGPGGTYNNMNYDEEVLGGTYHHLAIVSNPRYSDTEIIQNSKSTMKNIGGIMRFKFGMKKKAEEAKVDAAKENAVEEMEMNDDAVVEVDGKTIPVADMVKAFQDMKKAEAEAEAKKNATLELTDTIDVDGESIDVKTLLAAYKAATTPTAKNEDSEVKENAVPKAETKNANFNALKEAAGKTDATSNVNILTQRSKLAKGEARYGSTVITEVK